MEEKKKGNGSLIFAIVCVVFAIIAICLMLFLGKGNNNINNNTINNTVNNTASNIVENTTDNTINQETEKRGTKTIEMKGNCTDNIFETTYENDVILTKVPLNNKENTFKYENNEYYIFSLNDKEFYRMESREPNLYMVCSYDNHLIVSMANRQ